MRALLMAICAVAYHDRGEWARETPKVRDDPRFKECVDQMPRGYFIPEFGELASDIPPPMPVVDHRTLLKSLPAPFIPPKPGVYYYLSV